MMYAELNEKNIVIQVILATEDHIKTRPGRWAKACPKGINPKNYPSKNYTYVPQLNAYLPPKPGPAWTLSADLTWKRPKAPDPVPGNPVQGTYEMLLKDNNGKQIYEIIEEGPHKRDVKKIPVKIYGIVRDMRR